jgi:tRNA (guanine37-N1)-methyltransferase
MLTIEVITLMPELWKTLGSAQSGLVGRAIDRGEAVSLRVTDLRDYGHGLHRRVDDTPYGGGAGMVLMVEPLHRAICDARSNTPGPVFLLDPRGERFEQEQTQKMGELQGFTLVCGRYEGYDERIVEYVDGLLSLGDFVLSGGDPAAWAIIDAVVRLQAGVLGNPESIANESFQDGGLEHPHYTRPLSYAGKEVPEVLRSGNHEHIRQWRQKQAVAQTRHLRPDLLDYDPD